MLENTIRKLIKILKEEDIDEIEVRRFWVTVRVSRRRAGHMVEKVQPATNRTGSEEKSSFEIPVESTPLSTSGTPRSPEPGQYVGSEYAAQLRQIVSPMVGTFYRAPNPDAEPFVYEGKRVEVGEVICIIEAMKLMNEIESETNGVIRKVLVEDSQPVEYGQPLFLVESA